MDEGDFAELAKEVWTMAEAARENELLRLVEADIRFHEFVLSRSGQPHTTQVWRSIAPRIRAYFFRYGLTADLTQIAVEHAQLLQAVQTGNRDKVLAAVERHITVRTPGSVREQRP